MRLLARASMLFILLSAGAGVTPLFASETVPNHFRYMELERQLSETPGGPEARPNLFGVGEYFYAIGQKAAAAAYFKKMVPSPEEGPMDLVATVYLLLCARASGDHAAAAEFEESLKEALSSRRFIGIFKDSRSQTWRSPMENRYDLREEVDRLEVRVNGQALHTVELS
jgi:hypothetical protein